MTFSVSVTVCVIFTVSVTVEDKQPVGNIVVKLVINCVTGEHGVDSVLATKGVNVGVGSMGKFAENAK